MNPETVNPETANPETVTPETVPVVVVTHAGPCERTRTCLVAVEQAGGCGPVVVVDNSAGAATEVDAESYGPGVALAVRITNNGYGAAANRGFLEARRLAPDAGAIALLNDDIVVTDGWVGPLIDAVRGGAAAAQPKLLFADSMGTPAPIVNSVGVMLNRSGAGSDIGHGEADGVQFTHGADIDIFTGGAVLLSVDLLDRTGGFDERYFLYYEDVDLALRGAELGCRYRCEPDSVVWHEGGASTVQLGAELQPLQDRNRLWCAVRFASPTTIMRAFGLSVRELCRAPRRANLASLASGLSGAPKRVWERTASVLGRRSMRPRVMTWVTVRRRPQGVNLLGYHQSASGLGVAVRQLHESLEAAGVAVSVFDVGRAQSPQLGDGLAAGEQVVRRSTIAVVTAPELHAALAARPELREVDRVVGYWFWELAEVPEFHRPAFALVDEVWASTEFVADAYRRAPGCPPVSRLPLYLACPDLDDELAGYWRGQLAPAGEFAFLVTLDLFSVVERKNPFAAIDAFASAFESTDTSVRLVIKTLNGDQRPEALARIARCIAESGMAERVELLDAFVSDADMTAMVAAADCLISLHRGEGLGLHLADAMWLRTPVIASRYSGNLDFMDDATSVLIDVEMVDVANGEGGYPDGMQWAAADIEQAAMAMRDLVSDSGLAAQLATAARQQMETMPSSMSLGESYATALRSPLIARLSAPLTARLSSTAE